MIDQTDEKRNFSSDGGADSNTSRVARKGNNLISPNYDSTVVKGTLEKQMQKQNYDKDDPKQKNIKNGLRRLKELCNALFMQN